MKNYLILFLLSAFGFPATGQNKVGILTTSPLGTLDIHRGTANEGTLVARGTNYPSHFNYSTAENTFIRGGKFGSHVLINDQSQSGNVGIGILTNPLQKLHVVGSTYITDKLGLGVAAPNGTLQFANTLTNRKIVLWENFNNDNQFYGLGINSNMMRYQVSGTSDSHAFFAGTTSGTSSELMRIKGDGTVAIGTTTPDNSALLQLNSTTRGLLIPRMNTQQRHSIVSPEPGLMILNLDDQCIDIFDGTNWIKNCGLKVTGTDTIPPGWNFIADLSGTPREGAIAFTIGTKGYMGTGYDGSYKNDFWEYNPATNIWTQKADASPIARTEAVATSLPLPSDEIRGFMGTGKKVDGYLDDWWEYNPTANSWTQKTNFPGTPRSAAVAMYYAVGTGKNDASFFSDIWTYYPGSDTWSYLTDFPYGTHGAVGIYFNGGLLIGSGWIDGNPDYTTNIFHFYYFGQWLDFPSLTGGERHSAVAFIVNEEVYVGLGKTDDNVFKNDFWKINSEAGDWIQQSNFTGTARANAVVFTLNNKAYVGTGHDGNYQKDFRVYDLYLQGNIYSTPALPLPLYSMNDGLWVRTNNVVLPSNPTTSMIGIGLSNVANRLDINTGSSRTGVHPTDRSLYVTGPLSASSNGIEFRHSNGTQGIGFGYNSIYAAGSNSDQSLGLVAKGVTGALTFSTNGSERLRILGNGNVGIGTTTPNAPLQFAYGSQNRKIVLQEAANNDHQFFGFGIGGGELRYQVNSPADHVFYKGTTSDESIEQMRIRDNGNVDVSGTVEMGWERKTITAQIPGGVTTTLTCNCTSPKKVIGGGASADLDGVVLTESYPSTDSQWQVVYKNEQPFAISITVYAICARIGD